MNIMDANSQWKSRPADQRFQSLPDLRAAVQNRRMRSAAYDEPLNHLTVEFPDKYILVVGNKIRIFFKFF